MKNQPWSVAQQSEGYATDIEVFTGPDARQKAEAYRARHGGALVRGEQMWNEPIGQIEDQDDQDAEPHVGAPLISGANVPEGPARPNKAAGDFTMSKKTKSAKATTKAKPDAKRAKAIATAQATDAAANAHAVKPAKAKRTKTTTVDAGGGILVDVVEKVEPKADAAPAAAVKTKKVKAPKAPKPDGKMSGLDAAAKVLGETKEPMACKALVETMIAKGYWASGGKTPAATIYSAILREIDGKPGESRFAKTGRGLFALAATTK